MRSKLKLGGLNNLNPGAKIEMVDEPMKKNPSMDIVAVKSRPK